MQKDLFCMVNVVLLHYRRSTFDTKMSLFSSTFIIPCAIHLHNPLNINNISKTSQNCHLNAPKISLCVQLAVLSGKKCKYWIGKERYLCSEVW